MEAHNLHLTLPDGRTLGYDLYGAPAGLPILYFHGFMSSRQDWQLLGDHVDLSALGAQVIAIDRPGMGPSSHQPHRRIGDWADDVSAFADALSLDRFALLGVSGGGPYVLACARRLPERLTHAAIVSGVAPATAPGMGEGVTMTLPRMGGLARRFTLFMTRLGLDRRPDTFLEQTLARMSEADRAALANQRTSEVFLTGIRQAFQGGLRGVFHEASLVAAPWGFELGDIEFPIRLWHGEQDTLVPVSAARHVAETLPYGSATWWPEEGHLSWAEAHSSAIVQALVC